MRKALTKLPLFITIIILLLTVKLDARADTYRYWDGAGWVTPSTTAYTSNPVNITYDVTYCYEEAYKMIALVNEQRRKAGVPELQAKDELMDVAMMRAAETAICWSHTRPDGSCSSSASKFSHGENLHAGSRSASSANNSLVNSSGHYKQMIDPLYSYAGYGCVKIDGSYYWVQIFSVAEVYHEDGYDYRHPENNKPVQWDKMSLGNRKDYTAKFTAKVNPKLKTNAEGSITLMSDGDKEVLYIGEEARESVCTHYYDKYKKWTCKIHLSTDQYDVKVLTPKLCSYSNGKIKALKKGTAKIQYTLKADHSLIAVQEIEIKEKPIEKGSKVTSGGNQYKVTSTKNKTVSFDGGKGNATTISIPKTVKIQGKKYKVTSIAANAFKDNQKLKKVTIESNVIKIGSNAFSGCKNLKKITVKSKKIKTVGGNALKGIHKNAEIKVPESKLSQYKRLFKNKGQKKSVKIKK